MRSALRDATIELRDDGTAVGSSTRVWNAGQSPGDAIERNFGTSETWWSDQMPSSIQQAVRRARALELPSARFDAASLYRDSHTWVSVERIDATDWVVTCNHKRYQVVTDSLGNLLNATLPEYGVVIERRLGFPPDRYPLWPPDQAAPGAPYRDEQVLIRAPEGHVLAGTVSTPAGAGPFPAAVLITGLSPSDRDGGAPPWMPLRDLADALSRHGVAVLRVDDRGVAKSSGDRATSTTFDEANDVRTELRWLRSRHGIDARRVALVGYSEGGLIAPMVASSDSSLAGIVTMAGPGVSGPEVARYQIEAAVSRDTSIAPAAREAEIHRQLEDSLTVREKSYLSIDPMSFARRVRCPALILQGANDLQVPLRSAERLALAMRSSGNRDVSVRIFPGISHSFLPDVVGLNSGWAALPGFMTSPEVLHTITDWAERVLHAVPPHPAAALPRVSRGRDAAP
ncbi:MAG: alpha/beta hydrolase family protein [Candidatus Eiseniibacteriota bacterium]